MSAEVSEIIGIAGGSISVTAVVWFLVQRAIKKGDVAEEARNVHLEMASTNHSDRLAELEKAMGKLETRIEFREGKYGINPLTNPGVRPSPELLELIAKKKAEDGG